MEKIIQAIVTAAGAVWGFLYGGTQMVVLVLAVFMLFDYLTGLIKAFYTKTVNSSTGFKGISKKVIILILIAMVHLLEASVLKTNDAITFSVVFYYIANEGLSIIENALTFTPVPVKVKKIFEQLRDENDDEGDNKE